MANKNTKVVEQIVPTEELNKITNIPEFLSVSDKEKEDIKEEVSELPSSPFPFSEFSESVLGIKTKQSESNKLIVEAEKEAFDNQVKYMESMLGATIDPTSALGASLPFTAEYDVKSDMARSSDFITRKKKFLKAFPEGEYVQLMVPMGPEETKYVELFKKNADDKDFRFLNFQGFDKGDIPSIMGTIIDEQALLESLGYLAVNKKGLTAKMAATFAGARTGIELRENVESLRGYGEDEYNDAVIERLSFFNDVFLDGDDAFDAAISSVIFGAGDLLMKRLQGKRMLNIEGAEKLNEAAERLNLPPLLIAQLIANPAIRKSFYQAGEFTATVESALRQQSDEVLNSLKKFKESQGDMEPLDLLEISKNLEGEMAKLLQFFPNQKIASSYEQFFNDLTDFYVLNQNQLTKKLQQNTIKFTKKNADGSGNPTQINFSLLKNRLSNEINTINQTINKKPVFNPKTQKFEIPKFNISKDASKEAQELVNIVENLPINANNFADFVRGIKPNQANFERTFDAFLTIRNKAYNLSKSDNAYDKAIGLKVLNSVKQMMDPSFNKSANYIDGSPEFLSNLKLINNNLNDFESVMNYGFVKKLMQKTESIDDLTEMIFNPDQGIKGVVLQKLIRGFDEEPSKDAILFETNLKNLFVQHLIKDPSVLGDRLKGWLAKDPDTLKYYLGEGAEEKINQLKQISQFEQLMNNNIFTDALNKQGTDFEIIQAAIKEANSKKIGTDKVLETLINNGGENFVISTRAGIIENILNKSVDTAKTGDVGDVINFKTLNNEIDKLLKNKNYLKFFDENSIKNLTDYKIYISRLLEGGDVGGAIAGASQRSLLRESVLNPGLLVEFGITTFKNEVLARILAKQANTKNLIDHNLTIFDNAKFASILSAYDRLADEFGVVGTGGDPINSATVPQIVPSSMSEYRPFDESQVAPLSSTLPTLDSMGKGADLPTINSQVPIASNSTLSQANVINPNMMAAGQSVFGQDDPVFSGIMSTNVGRQRVA
tara:strand:- start:602 stop:3610 length:3009 start_codon:yes stop_codon:yes gene_type:complete